MKLDLKSWLLITAAVIIVGLLLYIKGCGGSTVMSSEKVDSLAWINKLGDSVKSVIGTKQALASENAILKDSIAKIYGYQKDKVAFLLATNLSLQKQLEDHEPAVIVESTDMPEGISKWQLSDDNRIILNQRIADSIKRSVTLYHLFSGKFDTIGVTLGKSNKLDMKLHTGMTAVSGWIKQKGWFKSDLYRVDLSFANPDIKISGTKSFVAPPAKQKRFGIGVQIGYGWQTGLKPSPYIGAGISYNIIRF